MITKFSKFIFCSLLLLSASTNILADATSGQMIETSLISNETFNILKNLNGSISVGYNSDFYELQSSEKNQEINLQLEVFSRHNDWKYGIITSVSKELVKKEKTHLGDSALFLSRPLYIFSEESSFSTAMSLALALPTSKESRFEQEMYTNISIAPALTWKNNNFNLSLVPKIGKIFNKYKTNFVGNANTSYYTKLAIAPSYQISNSVTTQFVTSVTQAWTDNHTRTAPTYASVISTDLKLAAQLSVSLAISNENRIYKSDGTSSNIKIFDKKLSVYSVSLTKDF